MYVNVIKIGLSDLHNMTVTVMKTSYCTLKSEIIDGKQYKYFFKLLLLNHLQLLLIKMMNDFVNIWNCLGILR